MDKTTFKNQLKRTFDAFYEKPQTMLQVAIKTGILRANICRYIATLRKVNKIALVKKGRCPITRDIAGFYTTDKSLFPKSCQVELFDPN